MVWSSFQYLLIIYCLQTFPTVTMSLDKIPGPTFQTVRANGSDLTINIIVGFMTWIGSGPPGRFRSHCHGPKILALSPSRSGESRVASAYHVPWLCSSCCNRYWSCHDAIIISESNPSLPAAAITQAVRTSVRLDELGLGTFDSDSLLKRWDQTSKSRLPAAVRDVTRVENFSLRRGSLWRGHDIHTIVTA